MDAAAPFGVLALVLSVVDRELSCRILRHVEAVHIRLSPRLKLIVRFFVAAVKDTDHGFPPRGILGTGDSLGRTGPLSCGRTPRFTCPAGIETSLHERR